MATKEAHESLAYRALDALRAGDEARKLTFSILQRACEVGALNRGTPEVWVAGAIYIAAYVVGERVNQTEVCRVVGVSARALRQRYMELIDGPAKVREFCFKELEFIG